MKRNLAVAAVGLLLAAFLLTRTGWSEQQGEKKADSKAKLERLRKERIETLEKAFQRLRKQLDVGTVALSDVIDIQREILEAQLEATDKLEERIGFLKAQLVSAQDLFDFIQKHVAAGFKYTETDLYRAKANCLKVEIELAKEEAKLEDSK